MSPTADRPPSRLRVAAPPAARPLLIFDGDCGFCRLWIGRWRAVTGDRVDYEPSQEIASRFPEIPAEVYGRSVVYIDTRGEACTGAEAVFRSLAHARWGGALLWLYRRAPGAAAAAEAIYGFIARRRLLFSRLTRLLWGADVLRPGYTAARCAFLRLMGLSYLVAFVSLWAQIDGLVGSRGILPAARYLEAVAQRFGGQRFWYAPTLCWIDASDSFLHALCGGGALLSGLVLLGVAPAPCLALMWAFYLSLTVVGQTFMNFQWDALLLETGFLSIFLAPLRPRCRLGCPAPAPRLPLVLLQYLLFRLMFSSGVSKLASGDPTWWDLSALDYHYETQCLPPWTAWYMHQMPGWFQRVSTLLMFIIELAAPFGVAAPRRLRHFGAAALVLFQLLIVATGNYGFFNLLALGLCLLLVDDTRWPARWRAGSSAAPARGGRWPVWLVAPLAAVLLLLGTVHLVGAFQTDFAWPAPVESLAEWASPFRSVNGYGLFRVMTTSRPEIIVEGSNDGVTWLPYEFRWKPGDPQRRPAFVAPHMPRLDWQMWFAALRDYRSTPWFGYFLARLLEGSPEVLGLLRDSPFPGGPPRYVRAILYDYQFTDFATRRQGRTWWRRRYLRDYAPALTLK